MFRKKEPKKSEGVICTKKTLTPVEYKLGDWRISHDGGEHEYVYFSNYQKMGLGGSIEPKQLLELHALLDHMIADGYLK